MSPHVDPIRDRLAAQLELLPDFRCRNMFGGSGLYSRGRFFGLVYRGRVYFRTGDDTRPAYIEAGMGFFQPNQRQSLKNYYEVPPAVVADRGVLLEWARKAIERSAKP